MAQLTQVFLLIFALSCLLKVTLACKITTIVRSQTKQPFKIRIVIPSVKAVAEDVVFDKQQKQVIVDGVNCVSKHWIFFTFKRAKNGKWEKAKEGKAKLDGMGRMVVSVNDDLEVRIGERFSVFCSESVICG